MSSGSDPRSTIMGWLDQVVDTGHDAETPFKHDDSVYDDAKHSHLPTPTLALSAADTQNKQEHAIHDRQCLPHSPYSLEEPPRGRTLKRKRLGTFNSASISHHGEPYHITTSRKSSMAGNDFRDMAPYASSQAGRLNSASSGSLSYPPILESSSPSAIRGRPQSHTRVLAHLLRRAQPPVWIGYPDENIEQPPAMQSLLERLGNKVVKDVIPSSLKLRLRAVDPSQTSANDGLFYASPAAPIPHPSHDLTGSFRPPSADDDLWDRTNAIYELARATYNNWEHESAWVGVVNMVLQAAGLDNRTMLQVHSVQTQTINSDFLPVYVGQTFAKKTDFALAFAQDHPKVKPVIDRIHQSNPYLALSQMTHVYTRELPLVCGLELKMPGGDTIEAAVQLGIWSAAGLERLRTLREHLNPNYNAQNAETRSGHGSALLPFLGWTVIGHEWKLHVVFKDMDSGAVTMQGPWDNLKAGTESRLTILKLLALIREVNRWLEEEYWEWLCSDVFNMPSG